MTTSLAATEAQGNLENVNEFGNSPFLFKRLVEYTPGESWVAMLYGPSKTGKTYFAGTAGPRTLFVNVGDGIETLMAPAFTQKYPDAKGMIMIDIRETNPNGSAEAFDRVCETLDYALAKFPDKFDHIILDEATALRKYATNKATELNTDARVKGANRARRTEEFIKVEVGDYGLEMQMIEWFLGTYTPIFKQHGKNFLMLAHERQVYNKPEKIGAEPTLKKTMPGFTGKTFPDTVPAYFDDVWHSEVVGGGDNVVYRIRTAGSEMEVGGSRHGGIFTTIETDPNYLKMLERIKAAQPKPTRR